MATQGGIQDKRVRNTQNLLSRFICYHRAIHASPSASSIASRGLIHRHKDDDDTTTSSPPASSGTLIFAHPPRLARVIPDNPADIVEEQPRAS